MTTWDILIPTLPHRHEQLCSLLTEFNQQWQPGLGVIVYRDNLQRPGNASYGKWQDLQEMSEAEYTSFIGDDDFVSPNYISRVMEALESKPDYVGYPVRYTFQGQPGTPVEHSLRHGRWENTPEMLYRDIVHNNPIRRELALLATWSTAQFNSDYIWRNDLHATGKVQNEVWIPEPMLYYQENSPAGPLISWSRWGDLLPSPMPESEIKPIPEYPWLTIRDEA